MPSTNKLDKVEQLQQYVNENTRESYNRCSRYHPLRSLSNDETRCFIKRDDELSFSISGSKLRKYLSLIPYLKKIEVDNVFLIGGAQSNHVTGLSQLLIENGIKPTLFLREAADNQLRGNRLFTRLLLPDSAIRWIARSEWPGVDAIARRHASVLEKEGSRVFVVPEGACIEAALPGALTLPLDVHRNETENMISFDHIFIDAGTCLQAIALILGLNHIGHTAVVHAVLMADNDAIFREKLLRFHENINLSMRENTPLPTNFRLYKPKVAASFGSVNGEVVATVNRFARLEGLFLDPIYTAKLFIEGTRVLRQDRLKGNVLFIHSGGALALTGYSELLLN